MGKPKNTKTKNNGSTPEINKKKMKTKKKRKSAPETAANSVDKGKEREMKEEPSSSGYIFMCNAKTKQDCYRHRVFGLPKGKLDMVEKIKPGDKLFLYDFDLKLLYGVYSACSNGGLNLVRDAFGGGFPAQVVFKIDEDCIPLPESALRNAIPENYDATKKFKPVLSPEQVRKLLPLFRPINLQPQTAPQRAAEVRQTGQLIHAPPTVYANRPAHLVCAAAPHDHLYHPAAAPGNNSYVNAPYFRASNSIDPHPQAAPLPNPSHPYYPIHRSASYDHAEDARANYPDNSMLYERHPSTAVAAAAIPRSDAYVSAAYVGAPNAINPYVKPAVMPTPRDPYNPLPANAPYHHSEAVRHYYPESSIPYERVAYRVAPEAVTGDPHPAPAIGNTELDQRVAGYYYPERTAAYAPAVVPSIHNYPSATQQGYSLPPHNHSSNSNGGNMVNVPVSSLYSFAGPPYHYP